MIWHSSDSKSVTEFFGVDKEKGLATGIADERLLTYGKNVLQTAKTSTLKQKILKQASNKVNIILVICALASLLTNIFLKKSGHIYEPVLILIMLVINSAICVLKEQHAENAVNTIRSLSIPKTKVLRDGKIKYIDASAIVPGDILVLGIGDYIAADARLIEAHEFHCDERALTGSSVQTEKNADIVLDDITELGMRTNMVYSGCCVVNGQALAVVTETGNNCEIGKAVTMLNENRDDSLLLGRRIATIAKIACTVAAVFALVIFFVGLLVDFSRHDNNFIANVIDTFTSSVALLVALVPEGLAVTVTAAAAFSVRDLIKCGATVKRISAFDTLQKLTVICCDKTGMLTHNTMSLKKIYDGKTVSDIGDTVSGEALSLLKLAGLATNQSNSDKDSVLYNDTTELAILEAAAKYINMSADELYSRFPRMCKIPFNSERKIMTSVNMIDGKPVAICKGAPEILLELCTNVNIDEVRKINDSLTADAYRVIAIAAKPLAEIPAHPTSEELENGLYFAGLLALSDPPRNGSITGVAECDEAGIRTVMFTGDHPATARSIARRIGILKDGTMLITGEELAKLDDETLIRDIDKYSVFARISPLDKLRILNAFKERGETVAVTGDSVNDAPALQKADIGLAAGSGGTDVARGAADIVLDTNHFTTIISAMKQANMLFANVKRTVLYLIGSNLGEFLSVLLGLVIFKSLPLAALQLLWINFITDCFPVYSIITGKDKCGYNLDRINGENSKIFSLNGVISIAVQSVTMLAATLFGYGIGLKTDVGTASAMAFTVIAFSQLFYMLVSKSDGFIYGAKFFADKKISIMLCAAYVLTALIILTPIGAIFGMSVLSLSMFLKAIMLSACVFIAGELVKASFKIYGRFSQNA